MTQQNIQSAIFANQKTRAVKIVFSFLLFLRIITVTRSVKGLYLLWIHINNFNSDKCTGRENKKENNSKKNYFCGFFKITRFVSWKWIFEKVKKE